MISAPEEGERMEGDKAVEQSARTTFADNVGATIVSEKSDTDSVLLGRTDPYPSDNVAMTLTRMYRLPSVTWAATDTIGKMLATISFPDQMILFPFISDRMKNYLFFRSRVRITLRINTTKYEYGSIVVSWLPYYDPNNTSNPGSMRHLMLGQACQNNGMILSANIGNSLTFEIPYISPLTYCPVGAIGAAGSNGLIGTMFIHVLTPLLSVSPNPPTGVEISIFAQFVDPELAGLQPLAVPGSDGTTMRPVKARPQMSSKSKTLKEAETKQQKNSIVAAAEEVSTVVSDITNVAMGVAGALEKLAPLLGVLGLGKPISTSPVVRIIEQSDIDFAAVDGLDNSASLTMQYGAQASVDKDIIDGSDPRPDVLAMCRRPNLWAQFSFDHTNNPDDVLFSIRCHPLNILNMEVVNGLKTNIPLGPLQWFSRMFRFWRGSLKVLFVFNTSSFTTTRVRITHVPGAVVSSGTIANYSGDLVSKIVDITGDTTVEVNVPWIQATLFGQTDWEFTGGNIPGWYNGTLMVSLVNPVNASDTTAASTVWCSMFVSAGEDYQLAGFMGPNLPSTPHVWGYNFTGVLPALADPRPVRAKPQMKIATCFEKPFEGLISGKYVMTKGMITQDPPGSVTSLGRRYGLCTAPTGPMRALPTITNHKTHMAMWQFLACHRFIRGSMRYRYYVTSGATFEGIQYTQSTNPVTYDDPYGTTTYQSGLSRLDATDAVRAQGIEIPYFQPLPFYPLDETMANGNVPFSELGGAYNNLTSATVTATYVSLGDDFMVGHACAPPLIYFS